MLERFESKVGLNTVFNIENCFQIDKAKVASDITIDELSVLFRRSPDLFDWAMELQAGYFYQNPPNISDDLSEEIDKFLEPYQRMARLIVRRTLR